MALKVNVPSDRLLVEPIELRELEQRVSLFLAARGSGNCCVIAGQRAVAHAA